MMSQPMLNPCPKCGSTKEPRSKWDQYDENLDCRDCNYFTGFHYIPTAEEVWNSTTPNSHFDQLVLRIDMNNVCNFERTQEKTIKDF